MATIKRESTGAELAVRRALHRSGLRYALHDSNLPGTPDIVLRRWHAVVLVHGCFWHRHPGCRYAYTPKSNPEWWMKKFESNKKRDRAVERNLRELGWKVIVIWECETRENNKMLDRVNSLIGRNDK